MECLLLRGDAVLQRAPPPFAALPRRDHLPRRLLAVRVRRRVQHVPRAVSQPRDSAPARAAGVGGERQRAAAGTESVTAAARLVHVVQLARETAGVEVMGALRLQRGLGGQVLRRGQRLHARPAGTPRLAAGGSTRQASA